MVVVVPPRAEQKARDGSFVYISSEKITQMARQTLANVKQRKAAAVQRLIEREKEELIQKREKKRNSFWSKLFGYKEPPMPSDEEILKAYKNQGDGMHIWIPETTWIEFRYNANVEVAYRLINAAKYADEVAVSTEDLARLI